MLSDCSCAQSSFESTQFTTAPVTSFASVTSLTLKYNDSLQSITFNTQVPDTVSSVCGSADGFSKCGPRVILFKDKTNSFLHRTRNIHIFEADYNLMLKIKWGQAMHQAEENNTLHTAQYGCRKGRTAHEPVFIETIQHEITRFTRQTYNQVNFDAQACFDRIIPNLAIRLSYKYGIPSTVLQTYQTTLKETKYFIKIGHHITKEFYKSTEENVLFGTGQGSGNSPILWILLSNELIDMYTEKTTGATYQDPSGKTKTSIHMTAYVDDINTHKTYPHYTPQPEMHDSIQQDISIWEKILYTSGGLISNTKCTYYTNKWEFSFM